MIKFFRLLTIVACITLSVTACKKNNVDPEKPGNGSAGGHEYVDLGLPSGIKWATCNVGASSPEEYGFYYAWGETNTKGTYNESTYIWYDQTQEVFTKYTWENNVITLESSDDAATANWGDRWRMPTQDEFVELQSNCNWQWTTQNNINGWLVKGPNGNSIFLPASGGKYDGNVVYIGERGYYWTSSLAKNPSYYYEDESSCAHSYMFDDCNMEFRDYNRTEGFSVRPVCSGKASVSTTDVSEVSYYSAICGGYVASASSSVKSKGVCWSTSQNPTINDAHTSDGIGTGSFTSEITGLTPNTKYFVRAYATNDAGTSYGSILSFVTKTPTTPTVTTDTIIEYVADGVIIVGSVTDDGGSDVSERGFCWSTKSEPTIDDNKVSCGAGAGRYVKEISGFENDRYYMRAFATNSKGTSYGKVLIAEMSSAVVAGHPYIDLGLPSGTLWATCNVGALVPDDYGDCYAWGEVETKDFYNGDNYKWSQSSDYAFTKYCTSANYGIVDNKTRLESEDDVATVKWGGSWRMPTYDELYELVNQCEMKFETRYNVKGLLLTGPNGNSIFMPTNYQSSYGNYWSNDLHNYPCYANNLEFYFGWDFAAMDNDYRHYGYQVRPVVNQAK